MHGCFIPQLRESDVAPWPGDENDCLGLLAAPSEIARWASSLVQTTLMQSDAFGSGGCALFGPRSPHTAACTRARRGQGKSRRVDFGCWALISELCPGGSFRRSASVLMVFRSWESVVRAWVACRFALQDFSNLAIVPAPQLAHTGSRAKQMLEGRDRLLQ